MSNEDKKVTGTCQACFRRFATKENGVTRVLVNHGYERPGHGYLVGRCWGVASPPYELDVEVTKAWHMKLSTGVLPSYQAALQAVKDATELTGEKIDYNNDARGADGQRQRPVLTRTFIKGAEAVSYAESAFWYGYSFETVQKREILRIQGQIEAVKGAISELVKRVKDWVYAPERLVETERDNSGPLIHASRYSFPIAKICGRGRRSRNVTSTPDVITCPDCRKRNNLAAK